jgi:hypothetical protein
MFEVEDNVPMPRRGIITELPLGEMEVNQSFRVPSEKAGAVRSVLSEAGKEMNRKFSYRADGSDGAIRVWRVA